MTQWYYELEGSRLGPVSEDEIRSLYSSSKIHLHTLVWQSEFGDSWRPLNASGISDLVQAKTSKIEPPPLPADRRLIAEHDSKITLDEQFLNSDITKSIIGERVDYYQDRWSKILSKSTGGPGKTHQVVSWNWGAFILPIFWLAYRKMYKAAVVFALIFTFIPSSGSLGAVLNLLIFVGIGAYGNSLYMQHVFNRYNDLNRIADKSLAASAALSKGGVSWLAGVTTLAAVLLINLVIQSPSEVRELFASSGGCSDNNTLNTVQTIARKNLKTQNAHFLGVDVDKSTVSLTVIRTQGKQGNLTNCAAHINYNLAMINSNDNSFNQAKNLLEPTLEKDITYTVQPSDDGQNIYVIVSGLN